MTIQNLDETQVRFWTRFRELPNEEKLPLLRAKVEAILPLQGFSLVWRSAQHIVLGYEGLFRINIHWRQWHRYAVEDDMIYIDYGRLHTPFSSSSYRETSEGQCLAWFPLYYLYGYLMKCSPSTNLIGALWKWTQQQFAQRNIDINRWLTTEITLYKNAFFLQYVGIEAIARVFGEEWEDFRAYVTAYEEAHASPNFPPTPPCP